MRLQLLILLLLLCAGCVSFGERPVVSEPPGQHDREADAAFCRDYAARYGTISLEPILGEKAQNQPDRRRRNRLFVLCMEEKGYRF